MSLKQDDEKHPQQLIKAALGQPIDGIEDIFAKHGYYKGKNAQYSSARWLESADYIITFESKDGVVTSCVAVQKIPLYGVKLSWGEEYNFTSSKDVTNLIASFLNSVKGRDVVAGDFDININVARSQWSAELKEVQPVPVET